MYTVKKICAIYETFITDFKLLSEFNIKVKHRRIVEELFYSMLALCNSVKVDLLSNLPSWCIYLANYLRLTSTLCPTLNYYLETRYKLLKNSILLVYPFEFNCNN